LPTTLEDIKNKNLLIKYNPFEQANKFNLSKVEIYNRFVDLKELNLAKELVKNPYQSN
jgi:hypothetical protein